MSELTKCTAYRNEDACSLRWDCQLYKNYLALYTKAEMNKMPPKPTTIKVEYENDGKMGRHKCKNYKKQTPNLP